jgi:EF-P beta-lysylation protein EpmB
MITPNRTLWQPDTWQKLLQNAFRQPQALLDYLGLENNDHVIDQHPDFKMLVPEPFARRMQPGNPHDPLLLQVLPSNEENQQSDGFTLDPLMETDPTLSFQRAPTLIQKYQGRVLMITTPGCAVNCRYCFRRHFPYQDHRPTAHGEALAVIRTDSSVEEVILSGGDPLLLSDRAMNELFDEINAIDHIKRIRLHSRLPIVLPQRVTEDLLKVFTQSRCPVTLVVHCNHAQELSADTADAFAQLRQAGVHLLNQSVLLRQINDQTTTLCQLSVALFDQGVLPYYLHMPDPVAGTAHFYVTDQEALRLHDELRAILPGYLLPRLVREEAGKASKSELNAETIPALSPA